MSDTLFYHNFVNLRKWVFRKVTDGQIDMSSYKTQKMKMKQN